ncbi:hypothetical protein KY348_00280 [Candidatus Woesearchaeota archaeon]|nr:hypothetical protein [Candidatus Woesearchaeota archaeon]
MPPLYQDKELTKENVLSILREIDSDLEGLQRKLRLYCLGGTQLALIDLRTVSKDIDFIVSHNDWMMLSGPVARIENKKEIRFDVFPGGELPNYTYQSYTFHAKKLPFYFNNLEIYSIDDADFVLTKALSGRGIDYEDIDTLLSGGIEIPKEVLVERFKGVKPMKGKEREIKDKFEKFLNEFYK